RYLVVSRDPARRPPPSLPTRRSSHLEAQPVRLAEAVVGILSEDDHLHRVEGRGFEGREDLRTGRIDPRTGHLALAQEGRQRAHVDRKSTRLNSSHVKISYAVFCLKKK